jgi:hypothetical protein
MLSSPQRLAANLKNGLPGRLMISSSLKPAFIAVATVNRTFLKAGFWAGVIPGRSWIFYCL